MTKIQWTNETWNPVTGCTKVSQGCKHCYAERDFPRVYAKTGRKFVDIALHQDRLDKPLRWTKPRMIFVNSMSDLFHEDVPDSFIDQVFAVMALCPQHTFQVLTKRPERMREYASKLRERSLEVAQRAVWLGIWDDPEAAAADTVSALDAGFAPNVWLGVSVEDQATANVRIPLLLETPAAIRWISYEPALGPIDFGGKWSKQVGRKAIGGPVPPNFYSFLNWIVVGGESGPGARPFDIEWARSTVRQCKATRTPVFIKQLGAKPWVDIEPDLYGAGWPNHVGINRTTGCLALRDRKGGDPSEWPTDLRVREWPEVR